MKFAANVRGRLGILIGAVMLLIVGSIPLLSTAQDSAPTGGLSETELLEEGERIYTNVCIACHQPDGNGYENIYLPLNDNPLVTLEDPTYVIATVLNGRGGMPRFDTTYDDEEVAAIVSYIRQEWNNDAEPVSAEDVADVRSQYLMTQPTPEGQIPAGPYSGTPDAGTPVVAGGDGEAVGTPSATP
jgi:mono/diheme cytochrome c family protein